MAKYAFNYDSGEYEYIERDGFSIDRGECVYTGMTLSIDARKKRKKSVAGKNEECGMRIDQRDNK